MRLDFNTVKNLKTPGRYTDSAVKGLHLWVKPNNLKYWIFRFTKNHKQRNMSLGAFPLISLAEARKKAFNARELLSKGLDPLEQKKVNQEAQIPKIKFEEFAISFINTKRSEWSNEKHAQQWVSTIKEYAFPVIANSEIDKITTNDILKILTPIWTTKTETASRLRGRLEKIFAAAITRGHRQELNPALWVGHLETILPAPNKVKKVQHHKALPHQEIPEFMTALRNIGTMGALALEFAILNASRTGEVLGGLKTEIQGDLWVIPGSRMKAKKEHQIPLCNRSKEILLTASAMDPNSPYLFSRNGRKLSNMAMTMILRRMNLDITVHGFRSTFRDWVSEDTDFSSEVAEMALAHQIANKVEAAYRRGNLLEKRKLLMSTWESYCLRLSDDKVIQLKVA